MHLGIALWKEELGDVCKSYKTGEDKYYLLAFPTFTLHYDRLSLVRASATFGRGTGNGEAELYWRR